MSLKMIVGADLVPTKSNIDIFNSGDENSLIGDELVSILNNVDYRIFNLEVPLTDNKNPIFKCGPNLIAPKSTIKGYKALKVDFLTLANNHILDQGESGLFDTIELLKNNKINYGGAGKNLKEASKDFIVEIDNKKVGIYCCAEHEFSIAEDNKSGANPFDPLNSLDHIQNLKAKTDFVIVLYHGGKEHYRYPSPYLQKVCRKIVEKGAALVVCQHSHCIGCEEKYNNSTIVYGQGNFIFDGSESEYWKTSLLIEIEINDKLNIEYIPIIKEGNHIKKADRDQYKIIMNNFYNRSEQIKEPGEIKRLYVDFADEMNNFYLGALRNKATNGFMFRVLNKLTGYKFINYYIKRQFKKKDIIGIENFFECEAHRELFIEGLKNILNK